MKKYLSLLVALSLVLTSFSVFAAVENDYVLTPDDGEVPYPPEVTINSQVIVTPLPIDEKNITLEEAEKSKIWEEYGYTKEEFDNFPESLRLILLYGDCTSTFKVRSTVALAEIFLTGFLPFSDMLCIDKFCFV